MYAPGKVALERPQRFLSRLALGFSSRQIGARRRVNARLGYRDAMEREVQLAVSVAVQAVALLFA